jgi:hypothetical protein
MRAIRPSAARLLLVGFAIMLIGSTASAAPKSYVFSGKLTFNRGTLINLPMAGNTSCDGTGLAKLTVMSGHGGVLQAHLANNYGCVAHVPGKEISTTGAGIGGAFAIPTKAFSRPAAGNVVVVPNAAPIRQVFTSFRITGPRNTVTTSLGGSMVGSYAAAPFRHFKKGAWMTQTGRQGSMFTWCWGNPACAKVTQGTKPLIVKYSGGGNAFGGTMALVVSGGPNPSNVAVVAAPGGPIGFGILPSMGSQPTGRGYAVSRTDMGTKGPVWGMYKASAGGRITMVSFYLGMTFPKVYNYNWGFPFTTMTVVARNTGTFAGNPRVTTLTAMGGDSVTAMGKRNISLVAGGLARSVIGPVTSNTSNLAHMYLPEPGGAISLIAGALALFAIAVARRNA